MTDEKILYLFEKLKRNKYVENEERYKKAYVRLKKELAAEITRYINEVEMPELRIPVSHESLLSIIEIAQGYANEMAENIKIGVFEKLNLSVVDKEVKICKEKLIKLHALCVKEKQNVA